jgi:hypothetical protein
VVYVLHLEFIILDTVAVAIFSLEYLMRMYSVVEQPGFRQSVMGRIRYAKSPSALIDILAIAPFFLEVILHHLVDLRFLRVFRLMRLLKLTRYTGATNTLAIVVKREWPVLTASAFVMLLLVLGNVILRYGFGTGINVSEELSRLMFIWVVFIGAVVAARERTHLSVDLLDRLLPQRGRWVMALTGEAIVMACCVI